ncbi:MAG TPA: GNAT family protein [Flavobacteriaceae bacterium]|nr:GNAT family protein [Flavobacteriaceae bacterium]
MLTLKGEHLYLRALEPDDLAFVLSVENDENFWEISHTQTPFSKYIIEQYLENVHKDIYEAKQLRLVICKLSGEAVGLIDLFDFDFKNKRAGVGIVIKDEANRKQGYASQSLSLLVEYSFTHLDLHQLYCNISEDNHASIKLFEACGFIKVGLKKDWNFYNGTFKNEYLFQRIKN